MNSPPDKIAGSANGPGGPGEVAATHRLWLKLAAIVLVAAALGLPINDLPRFALLVVSAVLVYAGTVSTRLLPWIGALAVAGLCVLGQTIVPAPRIE